MYYLINVNAEIRGKMQNVRIFQKDKLNIKIIEETHPLTTYNCKYITILSISEITNEIYKEIKDIDL